MERNAGLLRYCLLTETRAENHADELRGDFRATRDGLFS